MGAALALINWDATPLGPVANWSQALRTLVGLLLHNRFPMLLWWGPEFIQIYNDAYRPIPGAKHPKSLGQPAAECWPEIWHVIGPMIETPFGGGPATSSNDLPLLLNRKGFLEETHFKVAYSPVPDESTPSGIGGVLATVAETTEEVYARRQLAMLRELAGQVSQAKTAEQACEMAAHTMAANANDIHCALFYLMDPDGESSHLASTTTTASLGAILGNPRDWPIAAVARDRRATVIDIAGKAFPVSAWGHPPRKAVLLPLAGSEQDLAYGVLIVVASPHRQLDEPYRAFFELAAEHVSTAIRNARAFQHERERAEKLAALDRAKTVFFSDVSHEFRTPLTLMLGLTEEALQSASPHITGDNLAMLHRNELRLLKLVNTLLDFARIEAGRVSANFVETDIAKFTRELTSAFEHAIRVAGLHFEVECPVIDAAVYIDRTMWEKIVFNLLSNALKFTLKGAIHVRQHRIGNEVVLEVADTGAGIPAHELERAFERFHRIVGAQARTHEGSGIGLALVNELARQHGGVVEVESTLGRGSTFRVRLPIGRGHLPADQVSQSPAVTSTALGAAPYVSEALRWLPLPPGETPGTRTDPSSNGGRARVLIADDNADMRDYLAGQLSGQWDIETVRDGNEALAAMRRRRPDLLVSDVMMPGMDGFALLRAVRDDASLRDLQVILVSARAGQEATAEGLEAGADDYLVKPFSAQDLVIRVAARINAAKVRAQERRRLLTLLEQVPAVVNFLRGPDLVFEFAHPLAVKALGGRQLLGRKLLEAMPEHAGQPFYTRLQHVFATGEPFSQRAAEARLLLDGKESITYWNSEYFSVRDEAGRIEGVMTFDINVTEQILATQRAEHARAETATLTADLETLFANVPVGLSFLDRDLRYRRINRMLAEQINGQPIEAHIGHAIGEVLPALAPELEPKLRSVLETGVSWSELVYAWTPGQPSQRRIWQTSYFPIRTPEGSIVGVGNAVAEMTAQREADNRYHALVQAVGDIVWTNSAEGEMRGPQPAWCAYTGQSEEEVQGYGWSKALHPDDARPSIDAWLRAITTRTQFAFEHRVRRRDGVYRWFSVRVVPVLEPSGAIYEWVGLHRDIQEAKELAERERDARLLAEQASRAKDEFLAMLGHELRNPLAPIATAVHLLKLRSKDSVAREVSIIERQSRHIARLVDDLLDITRIARGKVTLTKRKLEISDLVAAAIETASHAIESAQHELIIKTWTSPAWLSMSIAIGSYKCLRIC